MADILFGQELYDKSLELAVSAHAGQEYAPGHPYIKHPLAVAQILRGMDYPLEAQAGGFLHDVIEDCDITSQDLLDKGVPEFVVGGIVAVTYIEGAEQLKKIEKARSHPLGHVLKFADASANFTASVNHAEWFNQEVMPEKVKKYASFIGQLVTDLPTPDHISELVAEHRQFVTV